MPVLDVDRLSSGQLTAAITVDADLKRCSLQGFSALAEGSASARWPRGQRAPLPPGTEADTKCGSATSRKT